MRQNSLARDLLMIEIGPPGGGVPRISFPFERVAPPQIATPPAPVQPTPILPTPKVEIMDGADSFEFNESFLGTPNSPQEALELLGFGPFGGNDSSVTTFPGGGTVHFCSRADGSVVQVREEDIPGNQRDFDMFTDTVC